VRQLKGEGRPVIAERERAEILSPLESVDAVVIFDGLTPREVIARLLPDILVKGGDCQATKFVAAGSGSRRRPRGLRSRGSRLFDVAFSRKYAKGRAPLARNPDQPRMILPAVRERLEAVLRHAAMEGARPRCAPGASHISLTGLHDVAKALRPRPI